MKTVRRLRAMASLCRQNAAYRPDKKWKLLAEAEYWEHLAESALSDLFKECTATAASNLAHAEATTEASDTECQSAAVALWREHAHADPHLNVL